MLAWRRDDVATLNDAARDELTARGHLTGAALDIDGRTYRAGDRVIALAPTAARTMLTSERGTVVDVDVEHRQLVVLPDGAESPVVLAGEELNRDRLDHGYATTVHRAQGMTVQTAHVLEDGGGRELAYVKASRATETTHVYVVADNRDHAAEELKDVWSQEQRKLWISDTSRPDPAPTRIIHTPSVIAETAQRLQREAERWAIRAVIPPDLRGQCERASTNLSWLQQVRQDIEHGKGRAATPEIVDARRALDHANAGLNGARQKSEWRDLSWRERRATTRSLPELTRLADTARDRLEDLIAPLRDRLATDIEGAAAELERLNGSQQRVDAWHLEHPDARQRLQHLERQDRPELAVGIQPPGPAVGPPQVQGPELGIGF
jgi:hypothetical protein